LIPKDCKTLADVREGIDALDRQIVPLLVARAGFVARAGQLKGSKDLVVDTARIEDVVAKAKKIATETGGTTDVIEAIYRSMIDAYIAFETIEWDKSHS
jgi:isochorismate pyruvate lyase